MSAPLSPITGRFIRPVHHFSGWFLLEGVLLLLLGLAAMFLPVLAGVVAALVLGWVLFIAGIVGLASAFRTRHGAGFTWALLSAILAFVVGVMLLIHPLSGLISLTFLLIAYFVADGVFMIFWALAHRRELSGRWEWVLINGIIDLVLAGIIIRGLPGTLVWVPGLLVGIDLVLGGASLIAMALAARSAVER